MARGPSPTLAASTKSEGEAKWGIHGGRRRNLGCDRRCCRLGRRGSRQRDRAKGQRPRSSRERLGLTEVLLKRHFGVGQAFSADGVTLHMRDHPQAQGVLQARPARRPKRRVGLRRPSSRRFPECSPTAAAAEELAQLIVDQIASGEGASGSRSSTSVSIARHSRWGGRPQCLRHE